MAKRGILAFRDPEDLERRIEEYFQSRWETRKMRTKGADGAWSEWEQQYQRPPTMAGLALALDTTRITLMNYGKGEPPRDPAFIPIIARAKARIAEFAEEALYTREAGTGAQFALRVNHRYGAEDEAAGGVGDFRVVMIPPASGASGLAIPKWQPEGDDDD